MKSILVISIIFLMLFSHVAIANQKNNTEETKNILIIHSYQMDYEWTAKQDSGIAEAFIEYFGNDQKFELKRIFLDGKKKAENLTDVVIQNISKEIKEMNPYAVITTDDLAFKLFHNFLKDLHIPIGFTGINGNVEDYGYSKGEKGITGSLERYNIPPTVMIVKKIRPSIEEILLISEPSITGKTMMSSFKEQLQDKEMLNNVGINKVSEFVDDKFEHLKTRLQKIDSQKTAVIFVALYTYTDMKGNPVSYKEIDKWVNENTNFLDIGAADFNVISGRLLSLASSGQEMGYYSSSTLFKALKNGEDPSIYSIRQHLPLKLSINQEKLVRLKLSLPYDILSYAQALNKLNE